MINIPNALTVLRLALIPVVAYCLLRRSYAIALPVFLAAALTDLADGYIARRYKLTTYLGATLDPIADKLNMLVATIVLAWQELLPWWLAFAIVGRDIFIVVGALAYRLAVGHLEIKPTMLSKINTVLEFALLLIVMAIAAEWLTSGQWLMGLFVAVVATIVGSAIQYASLWGRRAFAEIRRR